MIDFKKEIKLSDLVRRTEKAASAASSRCGASEGCERRARSAQKAKPRELVGIKIGATQLAAARIANNGSARAAPARPAAAAARASSPTARCATSPALAAGAQRVLHRQQAAAPGRPARDRHEPRRRPQLRDRRASTTSSQLANAVLFRAHDAVSIPVDEAIIDYRVLSQEVDESGTLNRKILLVAAYREPIERYVAAFREAGIELVGIDLEAFALLRALAAPVPEGVTPTSAVVVVNAGHERTTLAVSDGTRLRVHARARVGRLEARDRHRPRATLDAARGRAVHAGFSLDPTAPSDPRDARRTSGTRGRRARAAGARAGTRRLARVLPGPAGIAPDLGDPDRRRHEPPRRLRRRAREAHPRAGPGRRPARPRRGRRTRSRRATTSPRSPSRSDWGWTTDACSKPSARAGAARRHADGADDDLGRSPAPARCSLSCSSSSASPTCRTTTRSPNRQDTLEALPSRSTQVQAAAARRPLSRARTEARRGGVHDSRGRSNAVGRPARRHLAGASGGLVALEPVTCRSARHRRRRRRRRPRRPRSPSPALRSRRTSSRR